jgi:hypothetical protein
MQLFFECIIIIAHMSLGASAIALSADDGSVETSTVTQPPPSSDRRPTIWLDWSVKYSCLPALSAAMP